MGDRPKKPAGGAFGVWINKNRERIHKGLPTGSSMTVVSKVASEEWKKMSETNRPPSGIDLIDYLLNLRLVISEGRVSHLTAYILHVLESNASRVVLVKHGEGISHLGCRVFLIHLAGQQIDKLLELDGAVTVLIDLL